MTGLVGNILITGGTGTLGHAIAYAAETQHWDCALTIYSRSEHRQAQMRAKYPHLRYVLGDVADAGHLHAAIAGHDVVVHAAAMKRIPECEAQPDACWKTNVQGSANVVWACIANGVSLAIGLSTDKACRASTTYGASKLLLESLWQAQTNYPTRFVCVRYGNVVQSNGSVIPIWKQQQRAGLPLSITDTQMTRFWMAPLGAVDAIVQAQYEPPHTILVPKAHALSIVEMAEYVCPGSDHVEIGYRSNEKRHEDLVHPDEIASDAMDYFRVGFGERGHSYSSAFAPRLSKDAFLAMIAEADRYA